MFTSLNVVEDDLPLDFDKCFLKMFKVFEITWPMMKLEPSW